MNCRLTFRVWVSSLPVATAGVTAAAGIVGWVGLLIPHAAHPVFSAEGSLCLPASMLLGALMLLLCDGIARTRYLHPREGSIELLGRDLKDYTRSELGRIIGFVSQSGALPFNYPVFDYLLLGRAARIALWEVPSKKDLDAVGKAVEKAGIAALVERNVQELSAGEMQLVAVARALSQEPQVLLLDEPTSHLDPANALMVFRLMQKLSKEGLTVLFATHDPLHARQAAQRAVLLKQGQLLFSGDTAEGLTAKRLSGLYGVPFQEARFGGQDYPFLGL